MTEIVYNTPLRKRYNVQCGKDTIFVVATFDGFGEAVRTMVKFEDENTAIPFSVFDTKRNAVVVG